MSDNAKDYRLHPNMVSRLFKLCDQTEEGEPKESPNQEKSRRLRDLLAEIPPLSGQALAEVPDLLRRLHQSLPRLHGRPVGAILQDPTTPVAEFGSIKDYAKGLVAGARTEGEHEAAGVLYYAAIAYALVRHDIRITQHAHAQLRDSFTSLAAREWIPADLRDLFAQAGRMCAQHGPKG